LLAVGPLPYDLLRPLPSYTLFSLKIIHIRGTLEYLPIGENVDFSCVRIFANVYAEGCSKVQINEGIVAMVISLVSA
jgi:hypothetical protein